MNLSQSKDHKADLPQINLNPQAIISMFCP